MSKKSQKHTLVETDDSAELDVLSPSVSTHDKLPHLVTTEKTAYTAPIRVAETDTSVVAQDAASVEGSDFYRTEWEKLQKKSASLALRLEKAHEKSHSKEISLLDEKHKKEISLVESHHKIETNLLLENERLRTIIVQQNDRKAVSIFFSVLNALGGIVLGMVSALGPHVANEVFKFLCPYLIGAGLILIGIHLIFLLIHAIRCYFLPIANSPIPGAKI